MTQTKVIPLFAAPVAAEGKSSQKNTIESQDQSSAPLETNSVLSKLACFPLDTPHPLTGLKYGGYMPITCIIFVPELFLLLSPGQLKVLMYLTFLKWRYPERSGYVRAALPYLADGTGISRSTIHEILVNLEALRLIECMQTNRKLGNLYRVADLTLFAPTQEPKLPEPIPPVVQQSGIQTTENQTTEIRTTNVQNSDGSSPKISPPQSGNQTEDYSSLSLSNLFYSLSQHDGFKTRWEKLPPKAAKKERDAIKGLLEKNPKDLGEIYEALVEIETTGKAYDGQPCHSPLGLITSSWPAIKRIRSARKADSVRHSTNAVDTGTMKEREGFLQRIHLYVSSLGPSDVDELHNTVAGEIRKARPQIGEIRKDTRIYESFLEALVAARLGLELPESN